MPKVRDNRVKGVGPSVRRRLGFPEEGEAGPSGLQEEQVPAPAQPIMATPTKPSSVLKTIRRNQNHLSDDRIDNLLKELEAFESRRRSSDSDIGRDSDKSRSDISVGEDSGEEYRPPARVGRGEGRSPSPLDLDFGGFEPGVEVEGELERMTSPESEEEESTDSGETSEDEEGGRRRQRRGMGRARARSRSRGRSRGRGRRSPTRSRSPHTEQTEEDEGWGDDPTPPTMHPFTPTPGLTVPLPTTPLGFVQLFLTREMLEYLMNETADYATYMRSELNKTLSYPWHGCNLHDICAYLGLLILFGLMPAPDVRNYWRTDTYLVLPRIHEIMSRNRFLALNRYFHAYNRRAVPRGNTDRLLMVRPLMEYIQRRCRRLVIPSKNLSLDEGTLPYKGALSLKVYNPAKPKKYGIKFFFLTESTTGYVTDFSIYTGSFSSLRDTVYNLVERFVGQGYHLFMDNYYNSVSLAQQLYNDGIHCSGTLRLVRGAPRSLKHLGKNPNDIPRGQMRFKKKQDVFVIVWKGARIVPMVTTSHEPVTEERIETRRHKIRGRTVYERVAVQRPTIIGHYTRHMGGVDLFDQLMQYYSFARKSRRWTHKLILYLLQLAIQNAYILYVAYTSTRKKLSHIQFLEMVANSLLEFDEDKWPYSGDTLQRALRLPAGSRAAHYLGRGHPPVRPPRQRSSEEEEAIDDPATLSPRGRVAPVAPGTPSAAAASPSATPPAAAASPSATPAAAASPSATPAAAASPSATPAAAAASPSATPPAASPSATPPAAAEDMPPPERTPQPSRRIVDPHGRLSPGSHTLILIQGGLQRKCRVCHMSGRRKDTRYVCDTCNIPLCMKNTYQCHVKYHTLATYWQTPPQGTSRGRMSRVRPSPPQ